MVHDALNEHAPGPARKKNAPSSRGRRSVEWIQNESFRSLLVLLLLAGGEGLLDLFLVLGGRGGALAFVEFAVLVGVVLLEVGLLVVGQRLLAGGGGGERHGARGHGEQSNEFLHVCLFVDGFVAGKAYSAFFFFFLPSRSFFIAAFSSSSSLPSLFLSYFSSIFFSNSAFCSGVRSFFSAALATNPPVRMTAARAAMMYFFMCLFDG